MRPWEIEFLYDYIAILCKIYLIFQKIQLMAQQQEYSTLLEYSPELGPKFLATQAHFKEHL